MTIKQDSKHIIPVFLTAGTILIGVLYLFVMTIIESYEEEAPSTLTFDTNHLDEEILVYTAIFWTAIFLIYSLYSIIKGIKERTRFTFKEAISFLNEVVFSFVITWIISYLIILSAGNKYNQSDKLLLKKEIFYVTTSVSSQVKQQVGSRGSSAKTYYSFDTDTKNPTFKKIKTSDIFYSALGKGMALEANYFKGKLGYSFVTVRILPAYINKDLIDIKEKTLNRLISRKNAPIFVLYLLAQFIVVFITVFFVYLFTKPYHKTNVWSFKAFLVLTFFPFPFQLYFYFFVYSVFVSTVILAIIWTSLCLSVFISFQLLKAIYPHIFRFFRY